jgi:allantoin racemase
MRVLIVNPNTTEAVTSLMLDAGRASASPGVEVRAITAPRGLPYITNRAEAQIGGAIALEMLAEAQGTYDAAVLAAFGDPGLFGARELFEVPVIGISEAAMLTACMLGGRFLIVTFASMLCGWFRDCVAMHRLEDRCAGVVALDQGFGSLEDVRETNWEALVELANAAIAERDADVAILAGAPLAGLASRARDLIRVPVIDPIVAAVKQAEALLALGTIKASRGSFKRPAPKASSGLSVKLAAYLEDAQ